VTAVVGKGRGHEGHTKTWFPAAGNEDLQHQRRDLDAFEHLSGFPQERLGRVPRNAGIRDRLATSETAEWLGKLLVSAHEVALQHGSDDGGFSGGALAYDLAEDSGHAIVIFGAVAMAGIDHDGRLELDGFQGIARFHDVIGTVIGAVLTTAQDDVAVGIPTGGDCGRDAFITDAEEGLGLHGGLDGIDGRRDVAKGAIFEPKRHGEARGHLTVRLGFRGARSNGGPRDEIGNVLRGDGVEQLGGSGHADIEHIPENSPGEAEAIWDVAGTVEVGVHDEALPSDSGARFFKIDAHDDEELVLQFSGQLGQLVSIFESCFGIVNGAGACDNEEALVFTKKDLADFTAAFSNKSRLRIGGRDLSAKKARRWQGDVGGDVEIGDFFHGHGVRSKRQKPPGRKQGGGRERQGTFAGIFRGWIGALLFGLGLSELFRSAEPIEGPAFGVSDRDDHDLILPDQICNVFSYLMPASV